MKLIPAGALSIIIPVYNAAKYIKQCMDSILRQSYQDFKVILVDDGSSDGSASMLENIVGADPRFTILRQQNGGASAARNSGLEQVNTPFLTFVDIDDYIDENYLESLLQPVLQDENIDFVVQGFKRVNSEGLIVDKNVLRSGVCDANDWVQLFDHYELHNNGYVCSKLYKSQIVKTHNIHFDPRLHLYEDTYFALQYLVVINKVAFTADTNYNYLVVEGSLTTRKRSFNDSFLPFRKLYDLSATMFPGDLLQAPEALLKRWAIYMNDAIINNYLDGSAKTKRIENLKKFTIGDWALYAQYFQPFNVFFSLFKSLLLRKQFGIADFLMNLYFKRNR